MPLVLLVGLSPETTHSRHLQEKCVIHVTTGAQTELCRAAPKVDGMKTAQQPPRLTVVPMTLDTLAFSSVPPLVCVTRVRLS